MKNLLLCFLILSGSILSQNGYKTLVKLTDLPDGSLLQKMEENSSTFLSAINSGFFQNDIPQLDENVITKEGEEILLSLWETSPFRCIETQIIERILQLKSDSAPKYQVRNIPVFIKNVFDGDNSNTEQIGENNYQEICLTFTNTGRIENIFYSLESNRYNKLMSEGIGVSDIRRRQFILEFIENFRTAYNRRDIDFLQKVYSDDALIITGKVIKTKPTDMMNSLTNVQIVYQKQTKKEYIDKLKNKIFKYNKYINIIFEEIKISQDKMYTDIYGVNLKQYWNTTNYKDVGYLFLMIDFKDENDPMVHVRTWQPEEAKETKEGIFGLTSFDIER